MRNYYHALELERNASTEELSAAFDKLTDEQIEDEGDLMQILGSENCREQYQRTHLQYEAIAAVMLNPTINMTENTHSWDRRVVEFTPSTDTIEFRKNS